MVLADKIILLRKKSGLSQEELAFKLNVTRQSVSKWESAQSIPEIEKIVEIGKLFDISIDVLLNDNLQIDEKKEVKEESKKVITVTKSEAQSYIASVNKSKLFFALGVLLSVLSLASFVLVAEVRYYYNTLISYYGAVFTAIGLFIVFVVSVFSMFYIASNIEAQYKHLKKNDISLDSDAKTYILDEKKKFSNKYFIYNLVGTILCVLAIFPLIVGLCGNFYKTELIFSKRAIIACYTLVFMLIPIGTCLCAYVKHLNNAFNRLLRIEQYTDEAKKIRRINWVVSGVLYPIAAIIRIILFFTVQSFFTILTWPVAVLLHIAVYIVIKFVVSKNNKKEG